MRYLTRSYWKEAKIVTIVPGTEATRAGTRSRPMLNLAGALQDPELVAEVEKDFYVGKGLAPLDCIDLAHQDWQSLLPRAGWDLVLCGVNHGHVLGLDVLRSGSAAAAMWAATAYGTPAASISIPQVRPGPNRKLELHEERVVLEVLRRFAMIPGECWNVNLPEGPPKGFNQSVGAHYSYERRPDTDLVPRARHERSDVTDVASGFVTATRLLLRTSAQQVY
jgi:5'/3'-nucleotidase SurE